MDAGVGGGLQKTPSCKLHKAFACLFYYYYYNYHTAGWAGSTLVFSYNNYNTTGTGKTRGRGRRTLGQTHGAVRYNR